MALFQSTSNVVTETDARLNGFAGLQDVPLRPRTDQAATGRHSSVCTQVVWILFWFATLILVAYPIAMIAAIFYVILNPLSLINCMKAPIESLLHAINFPIVCARNMADAKQLVIM